MHIDPTNASSSEIASSNEVDHFVMRYLGRLLHQCVPRQQVLATPSIADQQLPEHQLVSNHFILAEEIVEPARKWLPTCQEANPYGRVDENHYAALRRGRSRRRGTSRAFGSEPRSARMRS